MTLLAQYICQIKNQSAGSLRTTHDSKHYCRELGFIPVEVNASDTRNKADKSAKAGMGGKLSNAIKELANNTALGVAQDGRRKRVRYTLTARTHLTLLSVRHSCACASWRQ